MGIIKRMRRQTAVYWALGSADSGGKDFDRFGQPMYVDPVEIKCRWEDVSEEYIDAKGTKRLTKSKVYVDRDVNVGGTLMLGLLTDVDPAKRPNEHVGADEIRRFDNVPNLRAKEFLKTAYL